MEWAIMHKRELHRVWKQAIEHRVLDKIKPLR